VVEEFDSVAGPVFGLFGTDLPSTSADAQARSIHTVSSRVFSGTLGQPASLPNPLSVAVPAGRARTVERDDDVVTGPDRLTSAPTSAFSARSPAGRLLDR
jgi:hypothetical protein